MPKMDDAEKPKRKYAKRKHVDRYENLHTFRKFGRFAKNNEAPREFEADQLLIREVESVIVLDEEEDNVVLEEVESWQQVAEDGVDNYDENFLMTKKMLINKEIQDKVFSCFGMGKVNRSSLQEAIL